jgi:amino acid adenylation domain-containing protein
MNLNELLTELSRREVKLWYENEEINISAPKSALTDSLRQSLKEHKAALLSLLQKSQIVEDKNNTLPIIIPEPEKKYQPFPLTPIQQAYWLGRKGNFEGGKVATHLYLEIDSLNLDVQRLENAWQQLIERHDMLRTIALPHGEQQVLKQVPHYSIKVIDLQGFAEDIVTANSLQIQNEMSHQVLSVEQWPAFDIRVSKFDENRFRIHISIDLFIADFGSLMRLIYEWTQLYRSPDFVLPSLEISFRDYVLAEKKLVETDLYKRSQQYWFDRLDELPPSPPLPLVKNPDFLKQPRFKRRSSQLSAQDWSKLKQKASAIGLTSSGFLLAAFADILTVWTNSDRFTLNLTFQNRLPFHPQAELIIGNTISVILVAIDNSRSGTSFCDRSKKIQEQLWRDLDRIYISGIEVLRELARRRNSIQKAQMPIVFTSVLGVESSLGQEPTVINQLGEVVYSISQTPQVWFDHQVAEENGKLVFNWDVVEDLFPPGMIDDMFASYCQLLQRLVDSDESWHETTYNLVPQAHLNKFAEINATDSAISPLMLHELFTLQAKAQPEATAIICPKGELTYGEVYHLATEVGHQLRQLGAIPNQLVAIVMEKGWEQVVAVLAILMSGAAYLPIDPNLPPERFQYLLKEGEVKLALTQSHLEEQLAWIEGIERICLEGRSQESGFRIQDSEVRSQKSGIRNQEREDLTGNKFAYPTDKPDYCLLPIAYSLDQRSLAYVIYTSGSTGNPKGVMQGHIGPVNTVLDINRRFQITSKDRVLALSALNFDLSVYDLFGTLAAGATLVIPAPQRTKDAKHWTELMIAHRVTVWNSVPYLMQMLTEYLLEKQQEIPADLRLIFMSGDRIPISLVEKIKSIGKNVDVISLGGPTETSIWNICYPIKELEPDWTSIPYGKPIANQRHYILSDRLEPCPIWVTGQLYAAGTGLAKGYWRDKKKTEAYFSIHPKTGDRIYKTGDIGRYLPDGNLEILGREDFQVKINGYRIELGEIETTLKKHPAIKDAVVSALDGTRGNKYLVAYVLLKGNREDAKSDDFKEGLRSYLKEKLPDYMVPCNYILLDSLPLNVNGKINRLALPKPTSSNGQQEKIFVAPTTTVEVKLAQLWSELLNVERISIHDNFFQLGGDSLLATQIVLKIQDTFKQEIDFVEFFEKPTIASIADYLETIEWAANGLNNTKTEKIEEVEF